MTYNIEQLTTLIQNKQYDQVYSIIKNKEIDHCELKLNWLKKNLIQNGAIVDTRIVQYLFQTIGRLQGMFFYIVEHITNFDDIEWLYTLGAFHIVIPGLFIFDKIEYAFQLLKIIPENRWRSFMHCIPNLFLDNHYYQEFLTFMEEYPEKMELIPPERLFNQFFSECLVFPTQKHILNIEKWESTVRMVLERFQDRDLSPHTRMEEALEYSNYRLVEILHEYGYSAGPHLYKKLSLSFRKTKHLYFDFICIKYLNRDHPVWKQIAGKNMKSLQAYIDKSLKSLPERIKQVEYYIQGETERRENL